MSTYTERLSDTGSPEYDKHFWNAMRGNIGSFDQIANGRSTGTGLYAMPNSAQNKYMAALRRKPVPQYRYGYKGLRLRLPYFRQG